MSPASVVAFDHVHLISQDPTRTARWYADVLGAKLVRQAEIHGAPQLYLSFGDSLLIVRGLRAGETLNQGLEERWSIDHFGVRIAGDFDAFCVGLKAKGVEFLMEPVDIGTATRVAFAQAPDGVRLELLERRGWPDLAHLGADDDRPLPTPP